MVVAASPPTPYPLLFTSDDSPRPHSATGRVNY